MEGSPLTPSWPYCLPLQLLHPWPGQGGGGPHSQSQLESSVSAGRLASFISCQPVQAKGQPPSTMQQVQGPTEEDPWRQREDSAFQIHSWEPPQRPQVSPITRAAFRRLEDHHLCLILLQVSAHRPPPPREAFPDHPGQGGNVPNHSLSPTLLKCFFRALVTI